LSKGWVEKDIFIKRHIYKYKLLENLFHSSKNSVQGVRREIAMGANCRPYSKKTKGRHKI